MTEIKSEYPNEQSIDNFINEINYDSDEELEKKRKEADMIKDYLDNSYDRDKEENIQ